MKKNKGIVALEIFLVISLSFTFSYFIKESFETGENYSKTEKEGISEFLILAYKLFVKHVIGEKGIVSAVESGAYTCIKTKSGSSCQEYPVVNSGDIQKCNEMCETNCLPTPRDRVSQCQLGTCYDNIEGSCQANSPKQLCEEGSGQWFNDRFENIPQCKEGCCVLGDEVAFVSDRQCSRISEQMGIQKNFKSEINNEFECLVLAKTQEEGACVFLEEFETKCKFTTKSNCIQGLGKFYPEMLCSNPVLNTVCQKQAKTGCVEGKDELYWFDSCGNRENIFDADKVKSWNDGKILGKENSCSLTSGTNAFKNQKTCGNCVYLLGSVCGKATTDEKASIGDFVCRDLRCVDENGNIREHGESWCAYQGAIGSEKVADGLMRGVDTAGSRHFRQVCIDGEIQTDPCADYRNEICVESQTDKYGGGKFSSAACRLNRWQQCINYNTEKEKTDVFDKCEKNQDCFVKEVAVGANFKFSFCSPKYPAGFDLTENSESAEGICALGNQECKIIYVKGLSGWKCKANCECATAKFAEQMNDFCISLGDCGTKANYVGDLTVNSNIKSTDSGRANPQMSQTYLNNLKKYSNPVKGKYAEPGNITQMYGELGIPEGLGEAGEFKEGGGIADSLGMIAGGVGVGMLALAHYAPSTAEVLSILDPGIETTNGVVTFKLPPTFSAWAGQAIGAAIGVAVVSIAIKYLGIGAGLPPAVTYALMAAGGIVGGGIGSLLLGGEGFLFCVNPLSCGIAVGIIIVALVVMKLLGVGKKKEVTVSFACNPWQPRTGGSKCNSCGTDSGNAFPGSSLPCSKYSCEALGQTCEFINEGTGDEECIDNNPNDSSPPIIIPLQGVLQKGYSYKDANERGVRVQSNESEGCVKSYSQVSFGIELNEPGQCKVESAHTADFDVMEEYFGGRNLYIRNHSMSFLIPDLTSLGLPGYDPTRKTEYSMYIRCSDKNGNKNTEEYSINFCVKPGEDKTAPIIYRGEPQKEEIRFGATEQNISIYTNEPSECKWAESDKSYELMENDMNCINELEDQTLQGWMCKANVPIKIDNSAFYIRCKDQPWLDESTNEIVIYEGDDDKGNRIERRIPAEGKKRNTNSQSFVFNLKRSSSKLFVEIIKPKNETIYSGQRPVSVEAEVRTSGGVDGTAVCRYALRADSYLPLTGDTFMETFSQIHKQYFGTLLDGEHLFYVLCEDEAGNTAEDNTRFKIEIDDVAPKISRVYDSSGSIVVITNENSECGFVIGAGRKSVDRCNFDLNNESVILMSGNELIHTADFEGQFTHYIKCKDNQGNIPGGCGIIIKGGV